jgi:hypothetical protein
MIKIDYLLIFLITTFGFMKCTSTTIVAGGASGTEVSGNVVDSTGKVLIGALVRLRPANYIFDSLNNIDYSVRHSLFDTITNSTGSFTFNNVLPDSYCVDITLNDSIAVKTFFSNRQPVTYLNLPPDTARSVSFIDGNVKIYGSDSAQCFLQIYGSEYKIQPDSMGYFLMKVPQGKHTMHIGAYNKPDMQNLMLADGVDITFNVNEMYKNMGTFRFDLPPPYPCDSFSCDSVIMRKALDDMGLSTITVNSVCTVRDGRIVGVSLRGIKIYKLSQEIQSLTELTDLDLGLTGIRDVLPSIGKLTKLSALRLDSNNINYLPLDIVNLNSLKYLNLAANKLSSFPMYMNKLTPTGLLDLSGNKLCSIDPVSAFWATIYDPDWNVTQQCP